MCFTKIITPDESWTNISGFLKRFSESTWQLKCSRNNFLYLLDSLSDVHAFCQQVSVTVFWLFWRQTHECDCCPVRRWRAQLWNCSSCPHSVHAWTSLIQCDNNTAFPARKGKLSTFLPLTYKYVVYQTQTCAACVRLIPSKSIFNLLTCYLL